MHHETGPEVACLGAAVIRPWSGWGDVTAYLMQDRILKGGRSHQCGHSVTLASIHLPQWLQLTSSKPPSLSRLIRRRTEAPNRSTKESAMMMARVIIECSHH